LLPNQVTLQKPIYFDYAATTPVHPSVFEQMRPYFMEDFGNAGSSQHYYGWVAEEAIQKSRAKIAQYFNLPASGILFTSGATESNNLAILGYLSDKKPGHVITSSIEHKAVLAVCKQLESQGWSVTYLLPNKHGMIEPSAVRAAIQPNTALITLMLVNNELGTITDYQAIRSLADQHQIVFHSDATQAIGKLDLQTAHLAHLISFSGHKIYGPKGVGVLVVQSGIAMKPIVFGGDQERGLRSGTLAVPQIVGIAACFDLMPDLIKQADVLRVYKAKILASFPNTWTINGQHGNSVPHILSISLPNTDWETLFQRIPAIAVSNGSACNAKTHLPSHVLKAIGLSDSLALATLRISLGYFTSASDVDFLIDYINEKLVKL
jgi:cysteine desulfurase